MQKTRAPGVQPSQPRQNWPAVGTWVSEDLGAAAPAPKRGKITRRKEKIIVFSCIQRALKEQSAKIHNLGKRIVRLQGRNRARDARDRSSRGPTVGVCHFLEGSQKKPPSRRRRADARSSMPGIQCAHGSPNTVAELFKLKICGNFACRRRLGGFGVYVWLALWHFWHVKAHEVGKRRTFSFGCWSSMTALNAGAWRTGSP
jgi:hypothetical protein